MSTKDKVLVSTRECPLCREALNVYRMKAGVFVAIEQASEISGESKEHTCWDLPQDANLIVIEPSPEGL